MVYMSPVSLNGVYLYKKPTMNVRFPQEKQSLTKNECQIILPEFIATSLVNLYSFGAWGIYGW